MYATTNACTAKYLSFPAAHISAKEVWVRLGTWYHTTKQCRIDRLHTSRSCPDEDTTANLGKLGQGLIRDG